MITMASKSHVTQNIGLFDRVLRLLLGITLFAIAYYYAMPGSSDLGKWNSFIWVIALYPVFTGMLGWEPLYALMNVRSCNDTGRNRCGTLPYQIKVMFGRAPEYCETETDHSLESCHEDSAEHPKHKLWRVDRGPALYPDEEAWHSYFTRKNRKKAA